MALIGNPALCRDNGGRLWVAWCINGKVNVRHQPTPGTGMTPWSNIQGGTPAGELDSVGIACNNDGCIEVWAVSTAAPPFGGQMYAARQALAGPTQPFGSFIAV